MSQTLGTSALAIAVWCFASMVSASPPDDSEAARQAAIERLRAAPASAVCGDLAISSRTWGTSCASREFNAPPLLQAPRFRWQVEYGWWGTWSPWVGEGLLLTGSCANETNQGLSALDLQTGKLRWRMATICQDANLNGTMGTVSFHYAGPGKVLFALQRNDRPVIDWMLLDLKTGRVLEQYTPVKRGPTVEVGGAFSVLTASRENQRSYLNLLSPKLDRIVGRYEEFRFGCPLSENQCPPVFGLGAASNGMLFMSGMSIDQAEPPARELHAFDVATGALRWRHTAQPTREIDGRGRNVRSDDARPMIVDGKVIIRLEDEHHHMLRALDPATGNILWTTDPQPRRIMENHGLLGPRTLTTWIGAGRAIVGYVTSEQMSELMAWSTTDGALLWRRAVPRNTDLTASAGGVFYTAFTIVKPSNKDNELEIQGYEAATGTRLWSTVIPAHNRPFKSDWSITQISYGAAGGPGWRIGPDGALYGITLKGAYKLQ
jgi:outer membrane protein assembly factor BamB